MRHIYYASHLLIESTNSYLRFCIDGCLCGNTSHWHNAAFNVLYVGTKEWRVTPPKYKGMTGMQPMNTESIYLRSGSSSSSKTSF